METNRGSSINFKVNWEAVIIRNGQFNAKKKKLCSYLFKSASSIGIDLGSGSVKMIQLRYSRSGDISFRTHSFRTPVGSVNRGRIKTVGPLIDELVRIKEKLNFKGNRVNMCLDGRSAFTKTIILPPLNKREQKMAMQIEAEKFFNLKKTEAVIDYVFTGLSSRMEEPAYEYLLAAVPINLSESYSLLLKEAGFHLNSLEVQPLSVMRSLQYCQILSARKKKNILLVDLGAESTDIFLLSEQTMHNYRNLNTSWHSLMQNASNNNASNNQPDCYHLAARQLAGLIIQSLEYWFEKSNRAKTQPASLYLCGGGTLDRSFMQALQKALGIGINVFNPLSTFENINSRRNSDNNDLGPLYATACGLAVRGWF